MFSLLLKVIPECPHHSTFCLLHTQACAVAPFGNTAFMRATMRSANRKGRLCSAVKQASRMEVNAISLRAVYRCASYLESSCGVSVGASGIFGIVHCSFVPLDGGQFGCHTLFTAFARASKGVALHGCESGKSSSSNQSR